jgi:hypothetical protein
MVSAATGVLTAVIVPAAGFQSAAEAAEGDTAR